VLKKRFIFQMLARHREVKVKVYAGKHQSALRKGSQLLLTLAVKQKKEKQQRLMRIWRVVSHAIRPAPSPPEAIRSSSNHPIISPIITVAIVMFVSCLSFLLHGSAVQCSG
jgi:hypothetical protein